MSNRVPAEVFPPGEFLRDELEAREWTQTQFAEIIGRPHRLVNEVIAGKRGISPETANELGAALGTSAQFWMNLETQYQLSKASPAPERISKAAKLHEKFPVRELIKRGWILPSESYDVLETRVLNFYATNDIDEPVEFLHAARRQNGSEFSDIQKAWLCRVRQLASTQRVSPYTPKALRAGAQELERCLLEPEETRHVPQILNDCGVRFVVVEPIPGSKIDGACFWLEKKQPVIGLTLRHDRIDNFWFVLRHEIEHVLRGDGKASPIVDDLDEQSASDEALPDAEVQANNAAANFCVPDDEMADFIARHDPLYSHKALLGFSRLNQRHPGVVAGQLRNKTRRYELFAKYLVKIRALITDSALTDGYGHSVPVDI